jgi:hypothetical protein
VTRARVFSLGAVLRKAGGPYIGPRGGLWADPQHTVAWDPKQHGKITPHNCPVCHGLGHIIRRQTHAFGEADEVSSVPCRTCNKAGKVPLDPAKVKALGLPMPAPAKQAEAPPPAPRGAEQLSLLSYQAKPKQESLFDAAPAKTEGLFDERREDINRLRALYKQHGAVMPGDEKKPTSVDHVFWTSASKAVHRLAEAGDKEGARAKLLKVRETTLRTSKSPTIRENLAAWEADAEKQLGIKLPALEKSLPVKQRLTVAGLPIAIENPKGSVRRWYDPVKQERGSTKMVHPYGYIRGTIGADGEEVDVFVGPHRDSKLAVIINQRRVDDLRRFDEHKVMLGFRSAAEARRAYLRNYDAKGPQLMGTVRVWSIERLKEWLEGKVTEPAEKAL